MKVRAHSLNSSVARGVVAIWAAGFVASAHPAQGGFNIWTSHGPERPIITRGITALAMDPRASRTLYAGTHVGVFKTTDGGGTWSAASAGLPSQTIVYALAIDPRARNTLYAGTNGGDGGESAVFKSTDGGDTWSAASTGLPSAGLPSTAVYALAVDPSTSHTLYAGTYGFGVFKSTDGGGTWIAASGGLPEDTFLFSLAIDPGTSGTLYAGTRLGVFKTTDGGGTWSAASTGLPYDPNPERFANVRALAIDPIMPRTLYAGTYFHGPFKSTDGGDTWSAANGGLPVLTFLFSVAIDPVTPTTLYGGTASSGVFKTTDGGGTWAAMNAGLGNRQGSLVTSFISVIAIDPVTPSTVYAATTDGVFAIEQGAACIGDCDARDSVTVSELVMLVNVALGTAPRSTCRYGVPIDAKVDVALLVQAVNGALNGCGD